MCAKCVSKYSQKEIRKAKLCRICFDWCLDDKVKLNEDRLCERCERDIRDGKAIVISTPLISHFGFVWGIRLDVLSLRSLDEK